LPELDTGFAGSGDEVVDLENDSSLLIDIEVEGAPVVAASAMTLARVATSLSIGEDLSEPDGSTARPVSAFRP
jgi:hypothetical protein